MRRLLAVFIGLPLLLSALLFLPLLAPISEARPAPTTGGLDADRRTVTGVDFLGEVTFATGYVYSGTEVGGLSGITYDAARDVYYALSDDRSSIDPARFYSLTIAVADGDLQDGDVVFGGVTFLRDEMGQTFPTNSLDPEGITLSPSGTLYVSSEGDTSAVIPPFVNEFGLDGQQLAALPIPAKFIPNISGTVGVRNNLAFESLTLSPDGQTLTTATENALAQDGPAADVNQESLSRILQFDLPTGQPGKEVVYKVGPVPEAPIPPDAFRTNGLVELVALDNNGTYLAMERAFSVGRGNTVELYEVNAQGALDVQDEFDLFWEAMGVPFIIDPPVRKRLLLDIASLGLVPDNLEGLALGPTLADGRQTLLVISDNNFSPFQVTQFIALALTLDTIPAALPDDETPQAVDDPTAGSPLQGDSDDPAIWLHPTDPALSLVVATQKDGGLVVFDMDGQVVQTITPTPYGAASYNNVDLLYSFPLGGQTVDLAVVSDRANDTLAVFRIDPATRTLVDVTSASMPGTIFGVDDGVQTAYGLATYPSAATGEFYAFVSQGAGNQIAQLALTDDGAGAVTGNIARTLTLPTPTGTPADSQAEGMVADQLRGLLYVAVEAQVGLLKVPAEPGGGDTFTLVHDISEPYLQPDIEGLTIYYGANDAGYLIVSSQGNHTYAVFERAEGNAYLGSFIVGDNAPIDQANASEGAAVLNVPLGPNYPTGLLVVQDRANDPQVVAQNDGTLENISTNFKFVPWEAVATAFEPPLIIDPTTYDPRNPAPTAVTLDGFAAGDAGGTAALALLALLALGGLGLVVARRRQRA